MTNQRDPDRPMAAPAARDEGWGMLPILLVVALMLGVGYFMISSFRQVEPTTTRTTQSQPSASVPAPSPSPATTPTPTSPKQP